MFYSFKDQDTEEEMKIDNPFENLRHHLKKKDRNTQFQEDSEDEEDEVQKLEGNHISLSEDDLLGIIDHKEVLKTLGFRQECKKASCSEFLSKRDINFFLKVSVLDYQLLEIFFFNLQRGTLIPELELKPNVKQVVDKFIKSFEGIYEKKKKLYEHLATDSQVLEACIRHFGTSKYIPQIIKPHLDHKCELIEAKKICEMPISNVLTYEDILEQPNFIFGIWEEYLMNPMNTESLQRLEIPFISDHYQKTRKLWDLVTDSNLIQQKYQKLKAAFPDELQNDFPIEEVKEVLLKMREYDSNRTRFKIAIVGNNLKEIEPIVLWFLQSTQSKKTADSYQMTYRHDDQDLECFLYLLRSDNFRVCHFDCIIYPDFISYPNFHASFKHFTRCNLYCKNERRSQELLTKIITGVIKFNSYPNCKSFSDLWIFFRDLLNKDYYPFFHQLDYVFHK